MEETSPREVLLRHGKWITAKDFAKLIANKRDVSERQAKTLISKAYRNKEIKKHIFSDRTVIYGLAELGPPISQISLVEDSALSVGSAGTGGASLLSRLNPTSGSADGSTMSSFAFAGETKPWVTAKGSWNPPPKLEFFVTQNHSPPIQFPCVAFNLINHSPYRLKVRLEVRPVLGGRNLGLLEDTKGYYNGKAKILAEPDGGGFINGCFTVPQKCADSREEECTLEVRAFLSDQDDPDKGEYEIVKSWTYMRKENLWFFEPKEFTNGQ